MRVAPARSRDIAREQLPDPQPLLDACLRAHGVDGSLAITALANAKETPDSGATIREMTWIDGE